MTIAEELERLSAAQDDHHEENNKTEKCELNGWNSSKSVAPGVPRARLVAKDGRTLYKNVEVPERYRVTLKNWFHLVIECNWRSVTVLFAGGFLFSWSFFGFCYYLITMHHGYKKEGNVTCIENVDSLITAFLFSVEAQHTIGFGFRYMTDQCSGAVFTLTLQCICGVFLQTMLAGIVVAKVLRPKKRRQASHSAIK
ncbi:hypothetical protein WR25_16434 [Diploscapter pachys]|uniref:Potassium channel inwardly rectifying transmembrane domain-containing protein n=1 Tax=Diploscapter pachys TaxID=2018661 RepID=A0A2A2JWB5_9BILA|nr:hypothetical protein WR25_16434 [Diploscapter pachys]